MQTDIEDAPVNSSTAFSDPTAADAGAIPIPRVAVTFIILYLLVIVSLAGLGAYQVWPIDGHGAVSAQSDQVAKNTDAAASEAAKAASATNAEKEQKLVRFVMYLGVLGACIHAMTSMATYVGNKTFFKSWTAWYLLRPFIGGALAWISGDARDRNGSIVIN